MMKRTILTQSLLALIAIASTLPASGEVVKVDLNKVAMNTAKLHIFDQVIDFQAIETSTSEPTPSQNEEASKLNSKAIMIYKSILTNNSKSRIRSVNSNLIFITKALNKAQKEYQEELQKKKTLKRSMFEKGTSIQAMNATDDLKVKRLIDLHEDYEQQNNMKIYKVQSLEERIDILKERKEEYECEKKDLDALIAENKKNMPLSWEDKDKIKQRDAVEALNRIEGELIQKQYDDFFRESAK